jgi:hypothetical protein
VQQRPQSMRGRNDLAHAHAVFGDAVELARMPAEATLLREGLAISKIMLIVNGLHMVLANACTTYMPYRASARSTRVKSKEWVRRTSR